MGSQYAIKEIALDTDNRGCTYTALTWVLKAKEFKKITQSPSENNNTILKYTGCLLFRFQCTTNVSRTCIQAFELGLALMLILEFQLQ